MRKQLLLIIGVSGFLFAAHAQYDGAPMEKPQEKKEEVKELRHDKYPHSDNDWENYDVLHINRLPSAATFLGYPTKEQAVNEVKSASPYYLCLNDFWKQEFDISGWADITVPGNWELQGFGYPFYVGSGYGFKKNPPLIPADNSPVGSYKRKFTVPADWKNRQVVLHFGSVASSFYVWGNGKKIGYSLSRSLSSVTGTIWKIRISGALPVYSGMYICMPARKRIFVILRW